jgi:hypothetical protein
MVGSAAVISIVWIYKSFSACERTFAKTQNSSLKVAILIYREVLNLFIFNARDYFMRLNYKVYVLTQETIALSFKHALG